LAFAGLGACDPGTTTTAPGSTSAVASSSASATTSASAAGPQELTKKQASAKARTLVDAWLHAQNNRDFDAYIALYDKSFFGVRRTASGNEKRLDIKAWEADRKELFKQPQKVAADELDIGTWHGGNLAPGEIELRFVQRWRGAASEDHGPKVMVLKVDAGGTPKIVREELLSSTKGWAGEKVSEVDGTMLTPPLKVSARWGHRGAEGAAESSDFVLAMLMLDVRDSAGITRTWAVPNSQCGSGAPPTGKLAKATTGGAILEGTSKCGMEYEDTFRVVVDGAGIVVKDRTLIQIHGDESGTKDTGFQDLLRVKLAPGAIVTAE
jgi:hypothetical protein